MKIVLVRHGETNENASHCYLGHYDAELNERGRQQLRLFTEKIPLQISSIYSSDLSRAMESAQIIGKVLQLTPEPVFSLRELNFGEWECKTYESILSDDQERLEKWIEDPYTVSPPNGETLLGLGKRIDQWVHQTFLTIDSHETIMIVSHGGPIRWFLSKWVKGDPKEFWNVEGAGHGQGMILEYNERTRMFTLESKL